MCFWLKVLDANIRECRESGAEAVASSNSTACYSLVKGRLRKSRPSLQIHACLRFAATFLYYKRALWVIGWFCSHVFDSPLIVLAEKIKPQTVFFFVGHIDEFLPQSHPLCRVNQTLKDGVLYALAPVLAKLRQSAKPLLACLCFSIDIICNQHHHDLVLPFYFHRNGG